MKTWMILIFLCIRISGCMAIEKTGECDTLYVYPEDIVEVVTLNSAGMKMTETIAVFDKTKEISNKSSGLQFMIEEGYKNSLEIRKKGYKPFFLKFVVAKEVKYKAVNLKVLLVKENEEGRSRIVKKKEVVLGPPETDRNRR